MGRVTNGAPVTNIPPSDDDVDDDGASNLFHLNVTKKEICFVFARALLFRGANHNWQMVRWCFDELHSASHVRLVKNMWRRRNVAVS